MNFFYGSLCSSLSLLKTDFLEDEIDTQVKVKSEPGKTGHLPFLPKEEEMTEEEIDKMLEERYKPGSNFVSYAEDRFDTKRSVDRSTMTPSYKDPIIWKVKCMVYCLYYVSYVFNTTSRLYFSLIFLILYFFLGHLLDYRLGVRGILLSALCKSMLIFSLWVLSCR